jgi:poly-gamma-glutamate synthesis protein (capsule biosynthesis protein)
MVKVGFTGDFCPWLRIEDNYKKGNWKELFDSVKPFFEVNDANIIELECPLTTSGEKIEKTGPHLKAYPDTAEIISYLNCNMVATANNHFKDYGKEGLQSSYIALRKYGIDWMGSGLNFIEASMPLTKTISDIKFAFLNVAENEWTTTFGEEPGCNPLDLVNIFNKINEIRRDADFIIVSVHGGHELYNLPSPRMKKWYRFFVDAGADAVVGHHTHVISGYEIYKKAPIFYSLGNFCFDWKGVTNQPWNEGMLLRLIFAKGKSVGFEMEFVKQNNESAGVKLIDKDLKEFFVQKIYEINEIINDDSKIENAFSEYLSTLKPLINTWIQPYKGKILPGLHKRGLLPSLIGKDKKLLLVNLIRCESHRDTLLNSILKK